MKYARPAAAGVAAILAVVLGVSICGGSPTETTTTTLASLPSLTTTSSTSPAPTTSTSTTTTVTQGTPSPVNGLPVEDGELLERRVMAVKMDNHPDARPQSGLQEADAVFEVLVEGGLTRFIALFMQSDSEYFGPIRSVRPTDPTLVKSLGAPLQMSGGQGWVQSIVASSGVKLLTETSPNTFRIPRGNRAYERTLFGTTLGMRERADTLEYPDDPPLQPMFEFGEPAPSFTPASEITLDFSEVPVVRWEWDGTQYLRFNGDTPHDWVAEDGTTGQVAFDNILVLTAERYTASPPAGQSGSSVPAMHTTGEGQAILFHGGRVVEGTWERGSIDDPFQISLTTGATMVIPPGRLFIEVFPSGRPLSWE